jgi:hypothetical protein
MRLITQPDSAETRADRRPLDGIGLLNLVNLIRAKLRTVN